MLWKYAFMRKNVKSCIFLCYWKCLKNQNMWMHMEITWKKSFNEFQKNWQYITVKSLFPVFEHSLSNIRYQRYFLIKHYIDIRAFSIFFAQNIKKQRIFEYFNCQIVWIRWKKRSATRWYGKKNQTQIAWICS